jgi:hypothetical protein
VTDATVAALLRRNGRIRRALEQLLERQYHHASPAALRPHVWGLVSPFLPVLYQFVRKGDVSSLADLLLLARQQQQQQQEQEQPSPKRRRG